MTQIPVVLEAVKTRRDNTITMTFGALELPPATMAAVFQQMNKYGFLAFKESEMNQGEIDAVAAAAETFSDDPGKTPSKRLRGVLYRLWEKDNLGFSTFPTYYQHQMERLITHFKSQIENSL
jgi:hypothetical protein